MKISNARRREIELLVAAGFNIMRKKTGFYDVEVNGDCALSGASGQTLSGFAQGYALGYTEAHKFTTLRKGTYTEE